MPHGTTKFDRTLKDKDVTHEANICHSYWLFNSSYRGALVESASLAKPKIAKTLEKKLRGSKSNQPSPVKQVALPRKRDAKATLKNK
jgi:hypothetical protein